MCFSSRSSTVLMLPSTRWEPSSCSPPSTQARRSEIPFSRDSMLGRTALRGLSLSGMSLQTPTRRGLTRLNSCSMTWISSSELCFTSDWANLDRDLNSVSHCSSSLRVSCNGEVSRYGYQCRYVTELNKDTMHSRHSVLGQPRSGIKLPLGSIRKGWKIYEVHHSHSDRVTSPLGSKLDSPRLTLILMGIA